MFTDLVSEERESLLIQQNKRFCRFCPLCPGDNTILEHHWKVVVKLLGPNSSNLPALPVAVYVVPWICQDAWLEQKSQVSGHQEVAPGNTVLLLFLVQFQQYCCVCGNTLHAEGLRLVYTRSSQQKATGAAGPVIAGFGERQKADVLLVGC